MEKLKFSLQSLPSVRTLFDRLECEQTTPDNYVKQAIARTEGHFCSSKGVQSLEYPAQVALGITSKSLGRLTTSSSFDEVLENLLNNPSLEPTETKIKYHHGHYKTKPNNWIGKHGTLNSTGIKEMQKWMTSFIPGQALFEDAEISEHLCKQILLKIINDFGANPSKKSHFEMFKPLWHAMGYYDKTQRPDLYRVDVPSSPNATNPGNPPMQNSASASRTSANLLQDSVHEPLSHNEGLSPLVCGKEAQGQMVIPANTQPVTIYEEKPILDWTVLRFPDDQQNAFVVYHLKLSSWSNVIHGSGMLQSNKLEVGTIGEYAYQKFRPRINFIPEISEATREKAVQEAQQVLECYQSHSIKL